MPVSQLIQLEASDHDEFEGSSLLLKQVNRNTDLPKFDFRQFVQRRPSMETSNNSVSQTMRTSSQRSYLVQGSNTSNLSANTKEMSSLMQNDANAKKINR